MEKFPSREKTDEFEGGGPPEWEFVWRQVGSNRIEVYYGDVTFRYIFQDGRMKYNKRFDQQRFSRHLTDFEYAKIRDEAEKVFKHLRGEKKKENKEIVALDSPSQSSEEQFEFKF